MALNFTVVSTFQFALQQIINKQLCQRNCQGNISLANFSLSLFLSLSMFCKFFSSSLPLFKKKKVKPLAVLFLLIHSCFKLQTKRYLWNSLKNVAKAFVAKSEKKNSGIFLFEARL
jgi:hypothetical protein